MLPLDHGVACTLVMIGAVPIMLKTAAIRLGLADASHDYFEAAEHGPSFRLRALVTLGRDAAS
jgi:hypothetical protein